MGRRLHGRRGLKLGEARDEINLARVAAFTGGVDLNIVLNFVWFVGILSPPSRAAWIEIFCKSCQSSYMSSPPSRAAWIEIPF